MFKKIIGTSHVEGFPIPGGRRVPILVALFISEEVRSNRKLRNPFIQVYSSLSVPVAHLRDFTPTKAPSYFALFRCIK